MSLTPAARVSLTALSNAAYPSFGEKNDVVDPLVEPTPDWLVMAEEVEDVMLLCPHCLGVSRE